MNFDFRFTIFNLVASIMPIALQATCILKLETFYFNVTLKMMPKELNLQECDVRPALPFGRAKPLL